jgi:XTP/dITP diphosphohydrolase
MRIILATRNHGKLREIRSILSGVDLELHTLDEFAPYPEPPEDGETFRENALVKAKAAHGATGLAALADDSGLEVDALGGGPGIRSARYGGSGISDLDRCRKLLGALAGVPEERRGARFHCTMVLYPAPGTEDGQLVTEGYLYGRIADAPSGSNGFGYDPVFYLPERGLTVARLEPAEKNETSHRYRALVEMKWLIVRECGAALGGI